MYETGSIGVTVTNYAPESENSIIASLVSEGYACSVAAPGVIAAECDYIIYSREDAADIARAIYEVERDYCDCGDPSECEVEIEVKIERTETNSYLFSAEDFASNGDYWRSGYVPGSESDQDDRLLDELNS